MFQSQDKSDSDVPRAPDVIVLSLRPDVLLVHHLEPAHSPASARPPALCHLGKEKGEK